MYQQFLQIDVCLLTYCITKCYDLCGVSSSATETQQLLGQDTIAL